MSLRGARVVRRGGGLSKPIWRRTPSCFRQRPNLITLAEMAVGAMVKASEMSSPRDSGEKKGDPWPEGLWGRREATGRLSPAMPGCPSPIPPLTRRAPFLSPLARGEDTGRRCSSGQPSQLCLDRQVRSRNDDEIFRKRDENVVRHADALVRVLQRKFIAGGHAPFVGQHLPVGR